MGLGKFKDGSSNSAARFLVRAGAQVTMTDDKPRAALRAGIAHLKGLPVKLVLGGYREVDFTSADMVIRNPAINLNHTYLKIAREHGVPVAMDTTIFFENCPSQIIGVTGTRGKSTTSALIAAILRESNTRVFYGGNNLISPLTFLSKLRPADLVVLELSSWALEGLSAIKKSPSVAVVTNIYPDHLNTYDSMADYIKAKKNIFKYQNKNGIVVLNRHNAETKAMAVEAPGQVLWFDKEKIPGAKLVGEHNEANMAAAIVVAKLFHIPNTKIVQAIKKFKGLSGRLELVRNSGGIKWYNDTTSTSPDGTRAALKTFAGKNIVLIAGGVDKSLPYEGFGREIAALSKTVILFPGTATEKMKPEMSHFIEVTNMAHAVRAAKLAAKKGDIVLLSPGAASMNIFKNEFDRGEQFVKAVKRIK